MKCEICGSTGLPLYKKNTHSYIIPSNLPKSLADLDMLMQKVSMVAKITNRYNQVPHLTQDTNGKVKNSHANAIRESVRASVCVSVAH